MIGADGEKLGEMSPDEAVRIAAEQDLDLVEVAPMARPPVCRIMDYGKFRYEQSKKTKQTSKVEVKTLTLRPKTDTHDLQTKLKHARKFLEKGNHVRFVVRMRGRERSHTDRWIQQLEALLAELKDLGQVTTSPQNDGRVILAVVEPLQKPQP